MSQLIMDRPWYCHINEPRAYRAAKGSERAYVTVLYVMCRVKFNKARPIISKFRTTVCGNGTMNFIIYRK